MRTLTKTFLIIAAYLIAIAIVYWLITSEDAGTFLLLGSAATLALVGVFLRRRGSLASEGPTPEDDPDADVRAVVGTPIGSFPFSSAWPIVLVGGLVLAALGALYAAILLPVGGIVVATAVIGLMRESRA